MTHDHVRCSVRPLPALKTHLNNAGGDVDPVVLKIVPSDGHLYHVGCLSLLVSPSPTNLFPPKVPSVVGAHEQVQKKKKELSKGEYEAWIAERSSYMQSARTRLEFLESWERRFKRYYEDDCQREKRELREMARQRAAR